MRLFVALPLPDRVAASLMPIQSGVPGARWQERAQLHLTLRFIGEVDGPEAEAVDDSLRAIAASRLPIQLKGVGEFGGRTPRALWAGIAPNGNLLQLQRKIETALQRTGLPAEKRKYTPHVTLARLKNTPPGAAINYLSDHALYAGEPFEATEFILYSSKLSPNGSIYVPECSYQLR